MLILSDDIYLFLSQDTTNERLLLVRWFHLDRWFVSKFKWTSDSELDSEKIPDSAPEFEAVFDGRKSQLQLGEQNKYSLKKYLGEAQKFTGGKYKYISVTDGVNVYTEKQMSAEIPLCYLTFKADKLKNIISGWLRQSQPFTTLKSIDEKPLCHLYKCVDDFMCGNNFIVGCEYYGFTYSDGRVFFIDDNGGEHAVATDNFRKV